MNSISIKDYIKDYKKNTINIMLEFLGDEKLIDSIKLRVEEMADKRNKEVEDAFIYGVDVSRGLISHIVKVDGIVLKDGRYYFTIKQGKKNYLADIESCLK